MSWNDIKNKNVPYSKRNWLKVKIATDSVSAIPVWAKPTFAQVATALLTTNWLPNN